MLLYILIVFAFGAALLFISSRVRRAAGRAFESEQIDAGEFTIIKPEGFINPIGGESGFAFEAYSKDFSANEEENLRQAQIFVSVFSGQSFDEICDRIEPDAGRNLAGEDGKTCLITSSETLENATAYTFYKIIESESQRKVYELKVSVLKDFLADYQNRVDETLESFRLK